MGRKKDEMKDMDFEIQFYEGILKNKPDFVEALAALGDLYTKKGQYEKGLKVDETLVKLKPDDPIVLYNLACSYSLINDLNKSYRSIKKAIDCGYDDFRFMAKDRDLSNLKKDSRFRKLLSQLGKK